MQYSASNHLVCLSERTAWVPVMHFCACPTLQSALESGQKAIIVRFDFSAAFDRVNHQGILYKLCSMGIGGPVLSTLTVSIKLITTRYGGGLSE